jgi:hypothetical protein
VTSPRSGGRLLRRRGRLRPRPGGRGLRHGGRPFGTRRTVEPGGAGPAVGPGPRDGRRVRSGPRIRGGPRVRRRGPPFRRGRHLRGGPPRRRGRHLRGRPPLRPGRHLRGGPSRRRGRHLRSGPPCRGGPDVGEGLPFRRGPGARPCFRACVQSVPERPRRRREPVVEGIGHGGGPRVLGGVVVQLPPPVVLVTGGLLPLLAHAPDCPPRRPVENGASGKTGQGAARRTARTSEPSNRNPHWNARTPDRRAAPPPTGEPPGGAWVTGAHARRGRPGHDPDHRAAVDVQFGTGFSP